ncbi:MAG TPA: condensation domain-containing protein, partial [Rugosimonospora sp.]|nr:condensation domain-containing protein [Rugosimonospora sp.]
MAIEAASVEAASVGATGTEVVGPVSFAQRAVWAATQLDESGTAYLLTVRLPLRGQLDRDQMLAGLRLLCVRHPALRTRFVSADGLYQVVDPPTAPSVECHDLTGSPDPAGELERLAAAAARTPFDLANEPSFRASLVRLAGDRHELVLTLHHIVCDATAVDTLLRDLAAIYNHLTTAVPLPPAPPRSPIATAREEAVRWATPAKQARLDAAAERLRGVPPLDLLRAEPGAPARPSSGGSHYFELDPELSARVAELAARHRTSVFAVCLAAFAILLSRVLRADDFVVGVPTEGRAVQPDEDVVTCLANLVPVRLQITRDLTVADLLATARRATLDVLADTDLPLESLVDRLSLPRDAGRHPLVRATCQMLHAGAAPLCFTGIDEITRPVSSLVAADVDSAKYDLALQVTHEGDRLVGSLGYRRDLFAEVVVAGWVQRLGVVLGGLVAGSGGLVSEVGVMSGVELDRVVRG